MSKDKLIKYSKMDNIAKELSKEQLLEIALEVKQGFEDDSMSRKEWENTIEEGMKLAKMVWEQKDHPWPGASNLKHPATALATINFAAYTYPELVRNDKAAEFEVIGYDYDGKKADMAGRMTQFINYQLLVEDPNWETALDRMLHRLPIEGTSFKKVYWDPLKKRNVAELCGYKEIYINNYVKSLEDARRITHLMVKHKNELISNMRRGYFLKVDFEKDLQPAEGAFRETMYTKYLEEDEYEVFEQHCYYDFDDDGYAEPYIVTVLSESDKVLRIKARYEEKDIEFNDKGEVVQITPQQYFVDYHYIPSPDGTYYSTSVASLLLALNKGINATLNMLMNQGTLSTTQGGFLSKSARIKGGKIFLEPGEWIKCDSASDVDLKKAIVPLEYKAPDPVLMQLLQFLVESAQEISSVTDVMSGKQNAQNVQATTIQILAEKGLKVFSGIQRRLYKSLAKELKSWHELNKKHVSLKEYKDILDYMEPVSLDDFKSSDFDINPIANPNLSSDVQRQSRAQTEMALLELPFYQTPGGIQPAAQIIKGFLEANNSEHVDEKLPQMPQQGQPPPDPKMIQVQVDAQAKAGKLDLDTQKHQLEIAKFQQKTKEDGAKVGHLNAQTVKTMADAQAISGQGQLEAHKLQMEAQNSQLDRQSQAQQNEHERNMSYLEMQQKQHEMAMDHQKHQNELAAQQHQMHLQHQQHQMTLQTQQQQNQMNMQNQQAMQGQKLQFDHQNQASQMNFQNQQAQNQMNFDKYKYDNDQQLSRDQMAQDKYQHDTSLGADYLNQTEQRDHERKVQAQQVRNRGMANPPRK